MQSISIVAVETAFVAAEDKWGDRPRQGGTTYSATDGPRGTVYSAVDGPGGPLILPRTVRGD